MLLKLGAPCRSGGQGLGTLWGLTVEPTERIVLRAVIEEPQAEPLVRVKVPFGRIDRADADQVVMDMSPAELKSCPTHDSAPRADARRAQAPRRRGDAIVERVLTRRARVHCRDGEVGTLSAVQVDSRSGDLENLSFPFGVPVTREIVVGFDLVEEIKDDRVSLRISMDELEDAASRRS